MRRRKFLWNNTLRCWAKIGSTDWKRSHFIPNPKKGNAKGYSGNGNPLQCSCLENPKDGGTWWEAVYCHPAYLTYIHSTSWETLGWRKHKLESRLPGEISITSDMHMTPPLWQKSEELKSLLMKVKEESEKAGLKLNIQKPKIMESAPITSWEIDGKQWKQCQT